uniref:protein MAIN-LIKE 1-like n=1 Tax=Erigeron canadensis TaxID=72917 RepID=UPI001CB8FBA9|nr:protein MAIN-LIKE 1-like [Erigeron canadensis]
MASVNVNCVPRNPDLFWLQALDEHRSYNVSHNRNVTLPRCRKGDGGLAEVMQAGVPEAVLVHVKSAGFFQLFLAGICQLDHSLINALVERWRPETNTFHLPVGEATVTLQDVQKYLGFIPLEDRDSVSKGRINFNTLALSINFSNLDEENEQKCICMARRIILALIGSELFLDANTKDDSLNLLRNLVDLSKEGRRSWGSATLCCLYRNLSKATKPDRMGIYGPLLLQYWAPTSHTIQRGNKQSFKWTSYKDFMNLLSPSCKTGRTIWKYMGPLVFWDEVEVHLGNRVARQFGLIQTVPEDFGFWNQLFISPLSNCERGDVVLSIGVKKTLTILNSGTTVTPVV